MKQEAYFKMGLNTFISFEEFMSAKAPCRNCLVKVMCVYSAHLMYYFGPNKTKATPNKEGPVILFKKICDETKIFLKKHRIDTKLWPIT